MNTKKYPVGSIISVDITSSDAPQLKEFYTEVIGWKVEEMPMEDESGQYADYILQDAEGNQVGGICHKRGMNQDLPAHWITYINVADVKRSVQKCIELGGTVLKEQKGDDGTYYYALIQDPVGTVIAVSKV